MSIHPSLSPKGKGKRSRSVFKRFERLKELLEKEKWQEGDSIFGLPKIKVLRWKIKKAKKAAEAEETTTEQTAGAGAEETKQAAPKKEEKSPAKKKP